ncbi:MAG TPA: hypothetical protein VGC84_11015 [Ilumatobacteraceae bacterium]
MNPDELADLEEQRRFLLRSITDLDREHEVGDVDEHDYQILRDGYTARAAAVLRSIDDGRAEIAQHRPRRPKVIAMWVIGTLLVASLAGVLVARASGQRLPGQSISGGLPGDQVAVKLAEARQFLGVDAQQAIQRYQQVLEIDPANAEALTYTGWLVAQSGPTGAPAGAELLRKAITIDPTYADPHCFLAITSADFLQPPDITTARTEAAACLANDPPSQMVDMIRGFVDRLDATPDATPESTVDSTPGATP